MNYCKGQELVYSKLLNNTALNGLSWQKKSNEGGSAYLKTGGLVKKVIKSTTK